MMKIIVVFACLVGVSYSTEQQRCSVHPPIGQIKGSIFTSRLGKQIYAFRGIRYAEPPVGELRFKVAVAAKDWDGVFDATQEGPSCSGSGNRNISEDCLRLNVYTTKLPDDNADNEKARPVIFYIHQGGYLSGTGQSYFEGPQYLLDQDIVLVVINHRLAQMGFMSTGDAVAPGNLGLKDQVVALKWVQRNIRAFGGDPDCVTIAGTSAGGRSVVLHMVSPMSKGLFHRAIAMSGSPTYQMPLPNHQRHLVIKQAKLMNCPTTSNQAMFDCFKTKPIEDFTSTIRNFFDWYGYPIVIWQAVVEPEVEGVERFLPAQPSDLIRQGKVNSVPLMIGVTKDEFDSQIVGFINQTRSGNNSMFNDINQKWYTLAPVLGNYERDTEKSKYLSDELYKFYFGNKPITEDNILGVGHLLSDGNTIVATHRAAQLLAPVSKESVYFYKFSFQGPRSFVMWNNTTPYGVRHLDDMQYLFYISTRFPLITDPNAPEAPMIERLTRIWFNFASTGIPIPPNSQYFDNIMWDVFDPSKDNYLNIDTVFKVENGIHVERMQKWDSLFPLTPSAA